MNRTSSLATIRVDQFVAAPPEKVGTGTRVFLERSGFDLNDSRPTAAFDRMGPGWRDVVLPRIAEPAARA